MNSRADPETGGIGGAHLVCECAARSARARGTSTAKDSMGERGTIERGRRGMDGNGHLERRPMGIVSE